MALVYRLRLRRVSQDVLALLTLEQQVAFARELIAESARG